MGNFLKVLGLVVALGGLILGVLDLTGAFSHPDRELMIQEIRNNGKAPASTPAFRDFLRRFPPPDGWTEADITGVSPSAFTKSAGGVTPNGPLIYLGHGKQTRRIATFEDLIEITSGKKEKK